MDICWDYEHQPAARTQSDARTQSEQIVTGLLPTCQALVATAQGRGQAGRATA